MTISVNGGEFNGGQWWGTDEGPSDALKVKATFDWDNDPVAVPEPATWALMIGGFGMAGATLRRRRAVAA
ncbi:MAG: PEP-CTERM sorting domain-containing protein [Phenylobacterium sp.]|nr:MAG: PEP-CTERM sorting domain-containing protein [Phenylobacterium sp.]